MSSRRPLADSPVLTIVAAVLSLSARGCAGPPPPEARVAAPCADVRPPAAVLDAAAQRPVAASGESNDARAGSPVVDATIADLSAAMAAGQTTAVALVDAYIARVEALDRHGPELRAIIELNPDARSIAEALDRERKERGPRGPLHGIPIVLKDNIATADRMETTAGSLALVGARPKKDAHVASRLRAAGAVILGKTNLSEWANIRSARSTSGWSARGGQTKNAYVLDRTPCGSSSGSGTAVAASLAAAAIGTETDGSITCPSAMSALVGIKPTVGLVSRSGIIPIAPSQDTAGPMTRTVRDAALLLNALADEDAADARTAESRGKRAADYTKTLAEDGLRGARIGIVKAGSPFHPDVVAAFDRAAMTMKSRGATIVDPIDLPLLRDIDDKELDLLLIELKAAMADYLAELGDATKLKTLADIVAWNEANRDRELSLFGQDLFTRAVAKPPLTSPVYLRIKSEIQRRTRGAIDGAIAKHRLDALIAPTMGPPWIIDSVNGDASTGGSSSLAAVAGYPNVTVPAGFVHELPVGIAFFGAAYSEPTLLRLAYAYEQASHERRPPKYLPHAP